MAKTSKINKNEDRKRLVAKYAKKRAELKKAIRSPHTSAEDRIAAQETLGKLPRDSNPIRVTNRCLITGRPRGTLRYFLMSRISFREMALAGQITGVVKSSW